MSRLSCERTFGLLNTTCSDERSAIVENARLWLSLLVYRELTRGEPKLIAARLAIICMTQGHAFFPLPNAKSNAKRLFFAGLQSEK